MISPVIIRRISGVLSLSASALHRAYPTYRRRPGAMIQDDTGVPLAPTTPPGNYWARLIRYRAEDGGGVGRAERGATGVEAGVELAQR